MDMKTKQTIWGWIGTPKPLKRESIDGPKEEKTPILDTVALRVEELQKGCMYLCILADNRRVQYIGDKTIKWYSGPEDKYKTAVVSDYQLKPLEQ